MGLLHIAKETLLHWERNKPRSACASRLGTARRTQDVREGQIKT